MEYSKKKRIRLSDTHRWTEQQTQILLQLIKEAVVDKNVKYEQPTSQKFYTINCQHSALKGIKWNVMKNKMRYLKALYMKAITWREQVGSELFESDKSHVEARMRTICPYYNQLNPIFEPFLPADPIRLTDNDFSTYLSSTATAAENDFNFEATDFDDSEPETFQSEIIPKIENEADDRSITFEEVPKRLPAKRNILSKTHKSSFLRKDVQEYIEEAPHFKSQLELECAKLAFERKKFNNELKYRNEKDMMSQTQLNFEKEKLEFEKRKFFEEQRLRKYEIDKQFEIKKMEIERDERLQRLELEMKYRYKPNDEVVQYDERSDYN